MLDGGHAQSEGEPDDKAEQSGAFPGMMAREQERMLKAQV